MQIGTAYNDEIQKGKKDETNGKHIIRLLEAQNAATEKQNILKVTLYKYKEYFESVIKFEQSNTAKQNCICLKRRKLPSQKSYISV